jgi:streptogramin lyase
MFRSLAVIGALAVPVAIAQTSGWRGPVSGILYDEPARALRPVVGVPGGSYLGPAIVDDLDAAFVSPNGESSLASTAGRALLIRSLRSDMQTTTPLETCADMDVAAWTADSRFAVAHCSNGQLIRIDAGGREPASELVAELDPAAGPVKTLAVNEDASRIVASIGGDLPAYYQIVDGAAVRLAAAAPSGACVFSRAAGAFFALSGEHGQVLRFSGLASQGWEALSLPEAAAEPGGPFALAVSRDGKVLYLASAAARTIRAYDPRSGALSWAVGLPVAPDALSELPAASSVFVVTARRKAAEPVWLFDVRSSPAAAFFVPGE